jgi:hypothetical protein
MGSGSAGCKGEKARRLRRPQGRMGSGSAGCKGENEQEGGGFADRKGKADSEVCLLYLSAAQNFKRLRAKKRRLSYRELRLKA